MRQYSKNSKEKYLIFIKINIYYYYYLMFLCCRQNDFNLCKKKQFYHEEQCNLTNKNHTQHEILSVINIII